MIFLKEYTIAEEHTYHVRHFCCFECDKPLAGLEYVSIEKQPVCLDCYQNKYGKVCTLVIKILSKCSMFYVWVSIILFRNAKPVIKW